MVKLNLTESEGGGSEGPTFDLGSAKEVFASHSKSRPGSYHLTVALETPVLFKRFGGDPITIMCTCPGFMNHRKCWHAEEMLFRISEPAEDEEE
jgi:hypothetical protein